jgi:ABC-type branched-subunit amino acid transport system substrate-binding protein/streptogramin lyase/predicted Ser/Thr protein kinase
LTTFAAYRIEDTLGRGGMGVVFRAVDLRLDRPVALKLIASELAQDRRFRERFLRESRLAASLDHPHVVPVYEAGEHEGQLFIAMRYVEGEDLKTLIARERTLAPKRALAILEGIAGALDTAHTRGLVHRDVKPANVLLDEREHAYLSDFGLSKQHGADSTQTGGVLGTFDYLAPEQIRGEPVDGRSDQYALGCLLYEVLAGTPPFRRESEAETLWAHMQAPPPRLDAYRELTPVLERALAKEKEGRYATCTELVGAAAAALGLEPPARRARRRRVGRRLIAAGTLLLAAGIAAAVVALTGGESSALATPSPNSVVQIDPGTNEPVARIPVGSNPATIAIGNGAAWVLNADDQTISRIDPTSKATKSFAIGTTPTDLAVGAGAVWIGNGDTNPPDLSAGTILSSVSRVDPDAFGVLATSRLRARGNGGSQGDALVVGKGAVWAINPDRTLSRLDPQTARVVATVRTSVVEIAAGPTGTVWGLAFSRNPAVVRVDPRTNAVTARIEIPTPELTDIAVGAGAVWASDPEAGVVWRIDPGPPVRQRTVPVAKGVDPLAYGAGSVWAVNSLAGTLSRIDPATNLVSQTVRLEGTPRDVAVGAGSVWISNAGAACGRPIYAGKGDPQYLVVSDLPLRLADFPVRAMTQAIELVFRQRGFRAGPYSVAYQSCDDSTSQVGLFEMSKCAANAKSYAAGASVIGVIGTLNSSCALNEIPFLNQAPNGPLAMVSPTNSYIGLTRPDPSAPKGQLAGLYPRGVRNYARVYPLDNAHAAAAAIFVQSLGARKVYVLDDRDSYGEQLAQWFRRAARKIGLEVVGTASWDPQAKTYAALAARVRRSGADAVFLGGAREGNGGDLLKTLRARLGPRVRLVVTDAFLPISELFRAAGATARSVYVTILGLTNERLPPAGRRFIEAFRSAHPTSAVDPFAVYAAQAADVLLDAIARSDGTRRSVTKELLATRVQGGILGSFRFDRNGDTTQQKVTILRPVRGGGSSLLGGATVVRVIDVPPRLLR